MKPNETQSMNTGAGHPQIPTRFLKACCRKDLMLLYGVSYHTLSRWLRSIAAETGPFNGRYFTTAQVKVIFDAFGYPGE